MSVFGGFSSYGGNCRAEDPPPVYRSVNIGEARRDHPPINLPPPVELPALVARGTGPFWQKIPGWRDAIIMEPDNEPYVPPSYFQHLDNPIPSSIVRDSQVLDIPHPLTRKKPTPRIRNDKSIEMSRNEQYYTLAPRSYPDHENSHDLFIRALSNEELEHLVGHYYDMWMWETGSDDHKETFEALLHERDLRKQKGWVVRRPSLYDVKKMDKEFGKSAFRKNQNLSYSKLKITLPKPGPKPYPRSYPNKIIENAFGKRILSRSFKEWLNGYLRRMPEDL